MNTRLFVFLALSALVLIVGQAEAKPIIKAKLLAVAKPHIAAHVAVATEVKAKAGLAISKSVEAIKSKKAAALAIVTAPLKVAAKKIALKVGAVKALTAKKVSKVSGIVTSLKQLPTPVILPLPPVVPRLTIQPVQPVQPIQIPPIQLRLPALPAAPPLPQLPTIPVIPSHPILSLSPPVVATGHAKLLHLLNALNVSTNAN